MHDNLTIEMPVFANPARILFNRSDLKDLRSGLEDLRSEVKGDVRQVRGELSGLAESIAAELPYFHCTTGKLEECVQSLEGK